MRNQLRSFFKPGATLAVVAGLSFSAFAEPFLAIQEGDASTLTTPQGVVTQSSFDIRFGATSTTDQSMNYATWQNPSSNTNTVKYQQLSLMGGGTNGTCYDISTTKLQAFSDPVIHSVNSQGVWQNLADDNAGNGQFHARIFLTPGNGAAFRISHWDSQTANGSFRLSINKINAVGGTGTGGSNCRRSGVPYFQNNLNNANPM